MRGVCVVVVRMVGGWVGGWWREKGVGVGRGCVGWVGGRRSKIFGRGWEERRWRVMMVGGGGGESGGGGL